MDFTCYICLKRLNNVDLVIDHLKKLHSVRNKKDVINCLVSGDLCSQKFNSFSNLRKHIPECINNTMVGS